MEFFDAGNALKLGLVYCTHPIRLASTFFSLHPTAATWRIFGLQISEYS